MPCKVIFPGSKNEDTGIWEVREGNIILPTKILYCTFTFLNLYVITVLIFRNVKGLTWPLRSAIVLKMRDETLINAYITIKMGSLP